MPLIILKHGRFPYLPGDPDRPLLTRGPTVTGPIMVSDDRVRLGRPTNVFNLLADLYPPAGVHYVPKNRVYHDLSAETEMVTAETLEAERRAMRGRPPRLSLATAREALDLYWGGFETITRLARKYELAPVALWRLVHGVTYWYAS
jgi:hypothetical protein